MRLWRAEQPYMLLPMDAERIELRFGLYEGDPDLYEGDPEGDSESDSGGDEALAMPGEGPQEGPGIHMHTYAYAYAYTHVRIRVRMHTQMHAHAYIHLPGGDLQEGSESDAMEEAGSEHAS